MSNLYELTGDLIQLQAMLEDDVDPDVLADTMEAVSGEYDIKMENYAKVIKNLEADAKALKDEADRLSAKRKVYENNVDRLKRIMFDSMKAIGKDKVKGTIFTVAIQKNGGKLPVIADDGASTTDLPDTLVVVTEKPNMDAIRDFLTDGNILDHYHLGERGESLRIK